MNIVIVNWNTGALLQRCLQSIQHLPEVDTVRKVYVVDNASSDDSVGLAEQAVNGDSRFVFIKSDSNAGFAAGNNMAIEKINHGHVLLLNPDTEVKPGAVLAMLNVLEGQPKAGVVGPALLNADGTRQPSVRSFPTPLLLFAMFLKLHLLLKSTSLWRRYMQTDFDYSQTQAVDQVMGAAFLIRDTVVKELGGLDESYWIWFEEVDYCKQVQDKGWKIVYTPDGEVTHVGGASFIQLVGFRKVWPFVRSCLVYAKKHFGMGLYVLLLVLTPIALLLSVPASLAHIIRRKKAHEAVA